MPLVTSYNVENDTVYCIKSDEETGLRLQEPIGLVNKTEVARLDADTVEDVAYTFDLDVGSYVEQSRTPRSEPLPAQPSPAAVKIALLSAACNAEILAGFTSSALGTPHGYDFDYDAQINLGGMLNAITAAIVTDAFYWKASGALTLHTIAQFKTVFIDGMTHKNTHIGRFWTLKAQVLAATTPEEIAAITW